MPPDPRTEEREQRWTLRGEHAFGMAYDKLIGGMPALLAAGDEVEVVPAARLAEIEAERDLAWKTAESLRATARGFESERNAARADLERAREALEEIERHARAAQHAERGRYGRVVSATDAIEALARSAVDALAASSPTSTEDRDA